MAFQTSKSVNRARNLRKNDTEAERRLWEAIRNRRLAGFKFVRQLPVGPYVADFACRERKLIVEVDGTTHGSETELRYDEKRTSFLQAEGFCVMRCWNDDVFTNLEGVLDSILLRLTEQL
jgi:very-short-patch-repair endonuclease